MKFLLSCIKGIALGAGAILPGISSGVLCVIFGIYEKLIDSILYFFKDIKNNIKFLFPLIIGGLIGVVLFGNILSFLFARYPNYTSFAFIGLILGCVPALLKKANEQKGFKLHYLLYSAFSFLLAFLLLYIEKSFISTDIHMNTTPIYLIFSGFIMSIGVVVPGVSSSVLLMILKIYPIYLSAVSTFNLYILLPMGTGLILGGVFFLKLIKFCFTKYYSQTYYCIIGFVLGSVFILYPGFNWDITGLLCILYFLFSFKLATLLSSN